MSGSVQRPRHSLSLPLSRRGSGYGNEVIPAAKAWMAAEALGIGLVGHPWLLNRRGYRKDFDSGVLDWVRTYVHARGPQALTIRREAWIEAGCPSYGELVRAELDKRPADRTVSAVVSDGMWGGYALIDPAKAWVRTQVLAARGVGSHLEVFRRATSGARWKIGVHVRRGDFSEMPADPAGRFNFGTPLEWFRQAILAVDAATGGEACFWICSDGGKDSVGPLLRLSDRVLHEPGPGAGFADLATLAACDLILCSVSSFSILAAWLGSLPYLWLGNQLVRRETVGSIWAESAEPGNLLLGEALAAEDRDRPGPCLPVFLGETPKPEALLRLLHRDYSTERRHDPIRYGAVRLGHR